MYVSFANRETEHVAGFEITEEMRPDVARLGVDAADGLETFDGGQRGSMSEMEKIIIL